MTLKKYIDIISLAESKREKLLESILTDYRIDVRIGNTNLIM
jgi:hypothetical protein